MSPRLQRFTSRQLLSALRNLGFEVVSTRGSHAKLRRLGPAGERQTLTVPLHDDLAAGTIAAIFRQCCRYLPEIDARRVFFR
jgi:predicted RNA binding protein YcfA (HicA-like mRNA interferase family)